MLDRRIGQHQKYYAVEMLIMYYIYGKIWLPKKCLCRLELTFVLLDVLLLKTIYKNVRVQIYLLWIVYCWFWTYFLSFKRLIKRQSYKINYLKVGLPVKKTLTVKFPPHSVDNNVLLLHVYVHSVESNWSFVTLKSGDKQTHLLP